MKYMELTRINEAADYRKDLTSVSEGHRVEMSVWLMVSFNRQEDQHTDKQHLYICTVTLTISRTRPHEEQRRQNPEHHGPGDTLHTERICTEYSEQKV